jgi:hypothetical protein
VGLCSLTGGYRGSGQDLLLSSSNCLWRQDQNACPKHSQPCTKVHGVLTQITLWILTPVSTSNPVSKNIKNKWSLDGNVTLGKLNHQMCSVFFKDTVFNTTLCFRQLCTLLSYFASRTNWENEIWNTSWLQTLSVQIHILGSGPHTVNFKVLLKWYHKDNHTVKTTNNVEHSQSQKNCLHYAQLSPHEIN